MLTIPADEVSDLIRWGDTRWINRGAHDLMGNNPGATRSEAGLPAARSLYGTLPEQLADSSSFARRLSRIIDVRRRYAIATGTQIDVPAVSQRSLLVMVHRLDGELQITVLNFSGESLTGTIRSDVLPPGSRVIDMFDDAEVAVVDDLHSFSLALDAYAGTSLLVTGGGSADAT